MPSGEQGKHLLFCMTSSQQLYRVGEQRGWAGYLQEFEAVCTLQSQLPQTSSWVLRYWMKSMQIGVIDIEDSCQAWLGQQPVRPSWCVARSLDRAFSVRWVSANEGTVTGNHVNAVACGAAGTRACFCVYLCHQICSNLGILHA